MKIIIKLILSALIIGVNWVSWNAAIETTLMGSNVKALLILLSIASVVAILSFFTKSDKPHHTNK